jgi:hypothetical protein
MSICQTVIEHSTSNPAHDGDGSVSSGAVEFGSRINFGCAGAGSTEIPPGVWRPNLLRGVKVFYGVLDD